jgi:DNA-binding protein YbaB
MDFQQIVEQAKDARHACENVQELLDNLRFAAEDGDEKEVCKIYQSVNIFTFRFRREVETLQELVTGVRRADEW